MTFPYVGNFRPPTYFYSAKTLSKNPVTYGQKINSHNLGNSYEQGSFALYNRALDRKGLPARNAVTMFCIQPRNATLGAVVGSLFRGVAKILRGGARARERERRPPRRPRSQPLALCPTLFLCLFPPLAFSPLSQK